MIKTESRYVMFVETATAFLLILYPSLMFAFKGGMNGSFLLLLLLAVGVMAWRPRVMPPFVWDRESMYYLFAMAALPIAIFLSQSYHHYYSGHPYDAASRFMLALPVFMLLRRVRFDVVALVQNGFPIAAIVGCLMIRQIEVGRFGIATLDVIHFGDFELILGVLSIFSINWTGRDALLVRMLKILGFLAGMYASIASGSRGGWIAIPIFMMIFIYFRFGNSTFKTIMAMSVALVLSGFIAYTLSQKIHVRVDQTLNDLGTFRHGNVDTSTGRRLQIYQAAMQVFLENPIFGVGPEGFALEMDAMLKAEKITPLAAAAGKGEVHNDILSKAAGMGVFGLIAILAIYFVPFRLFWRATRSASEQVKRAGILGIVFVSGFFIFGLTVEMLNLTMAIAFYSFTVAVLLAACYNIHHGEQLTSINPDKDNHHV